MVFGRLRKWNAKRHADKADKVEKIGNIQVIKDTLNKYSTSKADKFSFIILIGYTIMLVIMGLKLPDIVFVGAFVVIISFCSGTYGFGKVHAMGIYQPSIVAFLVIRFLSGARAKISIPSLAMPTEIEVDVPLLGNLRKDFLAGGHDSKLLDDMIKDLGGEKDTEDKDTGSDVSPEHKKDYRIRAVRLQLLDKGIVGKEIGLLIYKGFSFKDSFDLYETTVETSWGEIVSKEFFIYGVAIGSRIEEGAKGDKRFIPVLVTPFNDRMLTDFTHNGRYYEPNAAQAAIMGLADQYGEVASVRGELAKVRTRLSNVLAAMSKNELRDYADWSERMNDKMKDTGPVPRKGESTISKFIKKHWRKLLVAAGVIIFALAIGLPLANLLWRAVTGGT